MGKWHLSVRFLCDPLEPCTLIYARWVDLAIVSHSSGISPSLISFPLSLKQPWGRTGMSCAFCPFRALATASWEEPAWSVASRDAPPEDPPVWRASGAPGSRMWHTVCLFLLGASRATEMRGSPERPGPVLAPQDLRTSESGRVSSVLVSPCGAVHLFYYRLIFTQEKPSWWKCHKGDGGECTWRKRPASDRPEDDDRPLAKVPTALRQPLGLSPAGPAWPPGRTSHLFTEKAPGALPFQIFPGGILQILVEEFFKEVESLGSSKQKCFKSCGSLWVWGPALHGKASSHVQN